MVEAERPVPAADVVVLGRVAGIVALFPDTTDHVVAGRRLNVLNRLAAAPGASSARDALGHAVTLLAGAADVPLAAAYVLDGTGARASLAGVAGVAAGSWRSSTGPRPLHRASRLLDVVRTVGAPLTGDDLSGPGARRRGRHG